MKDENKRTLVLNADFTALSVVEWKQAITLDFKNVVSIVDVYKDDYITCSGGHKWLIPAVIVLKKYVKKQKVSFSRKNVFMRDKMTCLYCGEQFYINELTFDHIIPRSKWKADPHAVTSWTNIATSCHHCNKVKANKTLDEAGMQLIHQPTQPSIDNFVAGISPWSYIPEEWKPYLPKIYIEMGQQNKKKV